jgi:hypothetical protein
VPPPLEDHIRSVLDQVRLTVSGQLEAELTSSAMDILRAIGAMRVEFEREQEELRRSLDDAQHAQNALKQEIERARRSEEDSRCELEIVRAQLARAGRLSEAFRTLDQAISLGDILDRLAQSACQDGGRSAVFLVKGNKLRGWLAVGFGAPDPIVGAQFNADELDVVGRAARSGIGHQHRNGDALLPAFASAEVPRDAVAFPVQVGGSVIAVLYADAVRTDRREDPQWLDTIDAMTKHAGRVLEAMTVRQAAALWTPRPRTAQSSGDAEGVLSV